MKADRPFSVIRPDEIRDLAFDFVNDVFQLAPAEYLASAVFTLSVKATATGAAEDATPASRLSGSATITDNENGGTNLAAVQRVFNCIDGNTYLVECLALTSRGQELSFDADLPCRAAT